MPQIFNIRRTNRAYSASVGLSSLFVALLVFQVEGANLDQDTLLELLKPIQREQEMPGLRAAILYPDGTLVRSTVGLADVENNVPLDHNIGMPGGSTGKSFAATLVMLLTEDGTLTLDDFASEWVGDEPWFKDLLITKTFE